MSARPTPVEIVQPDHSIPKLLGMLLGSLVNHAISAWLVMLLLPVVWRPVGYWWALSAVLIVRFAAQPEVAYKLWSRSAR